MTRLVSLYLMMLICPPVFAQRVAHRHYITYYNASKMEPDSVVWDLTPDMVGCEGIKRKDRFARDPEIGGSVSPLDYRNTGFDKGHLFPYADAGCDPRDAVECFYMSNMLPQLHALNAGDWKTVEAFERQLAAGGRIHIIAGGIGSIGTTDSGVNIPRFCWKAIFAGGKWTCWIMPNAVDSKSHDVKFWQARDIVEFDRRTGLKL